LDADADFKDAQPQQGPTYLQTDGAPVNADVFSILQGIQ